MNVHGHMCDASLLLAVQLTSISSVKLERLSYGMDLLDQRGFTTLP